MLQIDKWLHLDRCGSAVWKAEISGMIKILKYVNQTQATRLKKHIIIRLSAKSSVNISAGKNN